ncbi:cell division regulator GpsB [Streptococcus loxodontisalivarius]|uniref:Cell cycle protein GpsB n=1 Tax=Streptococcus loxodontisalivarius TaxID=1349415 RepID=A0ABS2PS68_9STRE|nr:cell division regulator GpsB [Streptococcus loxodontisalivarius]MBM7642232.1 DivIVA domain-containing protein [Streptococcus loxodontisalivarius]
MADILFSPKDIFEQEFKTSMRGYDKKEVDEFLDDIIKDYESYIATIEKLREENASLKEKLKTASSAPKAASAPVAPASPQQRVVEPASNYDILKRISRLEKEVFGKQIVE